MKIYKDKQFLVFELDDGKTVKYDFATKKAIGKKGKPVKDLRSQLSGLSIAGLHNCCTDKQYGKFLDFVRRNCGHHGGYVTNIGTVLDRIPKFSRFEQLFSAGFDNVNPRFVYSINEIPKALRKICKEHNITLANDIVETYNDNPDAYQLAYNLEYDSLTYKDVHNLLINCTTRERKYYGEERHQYNWVDKSVFMKLINEYNYTAKALLKYVDYCKTFEAIDNVTFLLRELHDYCIMMSQISDKFDKYPRHFLTTHKIASRNYNRLKKEFPEELFKKHINIDMEKTFGEYKFIYPKNTQEIKDEAVCQNNCVASYIDDVLDGRCDILFLRYKDSPDKSLVTIEVSNGRIVQARQRFNDPCTKEQEEIIEMWNKWYANKLKKSKNESEEL